MRFRHQLMPVDGECQVRPGFGPTVRIWRGPGPDLLTIWPPGIIGQPAETGRNGERQPARKQPQFMTAGHTNGARRSADKSGLSYWMGRVLKEVARAQAKDSVRTIHDLRVALRRCRSMAAGLAELDPDPGWPQMKKASGRLFDRLGELRDVHVMRGWLEKLAPADDPVRAALGPWLAEAERSAEGRARHALGNFQAKPWKKWMRTLPGRSRRIPPDGLVFQQMVLAGYQEALELHHEAMRRRSREAWHRLRIGVKRFRYSVENFLPDHHARWAGDLKRMQDLLGEVHDLDMLSSSLRHAKGALTLDASHRWRARIAEERAKRLAAYKSLATGHDSLWKQWRDGLPQGKQLDTSAIAWFRAWAGFRDSDWNQRRRLVTLALQLFDGLAGARVSEVFQDGRNRRILYVAALTLNVGRSESDRGHHKKSYRMIRTLRPPMGWAARDLLWTALVARYHRGAEPREGHAGFSALPPADRKAVAWLAATLRLADALASRRPQPVTSVAVESSGAIHIWAEGWAKDSSPEVAEGKKHLMEVVSHRPVMIHAAPASKLPARLASSASA